MIISVWGSHFSPSIFFKLCECSILYVGFCSSAFGFSWVILVVQWLRCGLQVSAYYPWSQGYLAQGFLAGVKRYEGWLSWVTSIEPRLLLGLRGQFKSQVWVQVVLGLCRVWAHIGLNPTQQDPTHIEVYLEDKKYPFNTVISEV